MMIISLNVWEVLLVCGLAAALGGWLYDTFRYILLVTAVVVGVIFVVIFMIFKTASIIILIVATVLMAYIWYRQKRKDGGDK